MMFRYMKCHLFKKKKKCNIFTIRLFLVWKKRQQNRIITEAYKVKHGRKRIDMD